MISAILYVFGLLEFGYGIGNFVRSPDEILGPLAIGFSILTRDLRGYLRRLHGAERCLRDLLGGEEFIRRGFQIIPPPLSRW
jgi:hypothetical protein